MKPLIDGDVLVYELGFAAEYGKEEIPTFEYVKEMIDGRLREICYSVSATEEAQIYLTGKGNFREEIATKKEYKGNRNKAKPFHYENIRAYLMASYGAIEVEGMEADDALSIAQCASGGTTIICTRDKDLRMVPGRHYGWECGKQGEYGPTLVTELGELSSTPKSQQGTGLCFFYYQLLVGDTTDNIPGCPGVGPKTALKLLCGLESEKEMYEVCRQQYEEKYAENAEEELLEQAYLLWMVRELDEEGNPVMWRIPE